MAREAGDTKDGHIAVRVRAVGVNFRDVLNVLDMYPGEPGDPGGDCAGVVETAAAGLPVGTAVFGLAVGSLGTLVHCSPQTLVRMPPCLGFEEAASMPTVFITTRMAFEQAAAVRRGQRVLVHAAAGGVGLAALQVLPHLGAEIIATAGGPAKRALLRSSGVRHLAGSRDIAFVDELAPALMAGDSGGVDMALNSLTSPGMVAATLATLRSGKAVALSLLDSDMCPTCCYCCCCPGRLVFLLMLLPWTSSTSYY